VTIEVMVVIWVVVIMSVMIDVRQCLLISNYGT
jgi:hypothetical protein